MPAELDFACAKELEELCVEGREPFSCSIVDGFAPVMLRLHVALRIWVRNNGERIYRSHVDRLEWLELEIAPKRA